MYCSHTKVVSVYSIVVTHYTNLATVHAVQEMLQEPLTFNA